MRQAVEAYNDGVGSFQSRVLVQARRFEDLSATGEAKQIGEPAPVEQTVRRVDATAPRDRQRAARYERFQRVPAALSSSATPRASNSVRIRSAAA